ncbi:MAG: hypothetical protein J3K34DRAFT_493679 [Monoraphidium minutum]|nr:MAG: hypothetical protein J3K34DRAFT_493679 [Monoraphidium minutum]
MMSAAPLPAPLRQVPRLLLQAWLGLDGSEPLRVFESDQGLRDTPGARLLIAGARFTAGGREHAGLALLLASQQQLDGLDGRGGGGGGAAAAAAAAGPMAGMAGARLHWGSSRGEGAKWQAPEPGWNTNPADSADAGGGAWQSAFQLLPTPLGPVHALLLQLPAPDGAAMGIAAIVKAPGNRWLGDAATRRDFFIDMTAFPRAGEVLGGAGAAEGEGDGVQGPRPLAAPEAAARALAALGFDEAWAPLDGAVLSRAPPPRGEGAAVAVAVAKTRERRARAARAGAPAQPELPPPWAEGPARDKTQVVTLGGEQLAAAARARLDAWLAAQAAAVAPVPGSLQTIEFQIEGFTAPLAAALVALTPAAGGAGNGAGGEGGAEAEAWAAAGPMVAVAMVTDEGLAGVPKGLVLQWGAAASTSSVDLAEELPPGWRTDPSVSWDVGRSCWATPFEHAKPGEGPPGLGAAGCYHLVLALPLEGPFGAGGRFVFELRTSKGQWLRAAGTSTSFLLHLNTAARAAGPDWAAAAAALPWDVRGLLRPEDVDESEDAAAARLGAVAAGVVDEIAGQESKAERSLMHRFGIAADLVRRRAAAAGGGAAAEAEAARALAAVAVWLRFSGLRLLRWNVNYNVKPREISAALDGLGDALVFESSPPSVRGVALLALAAAGRGGEGSLGQRIRDEIMAIQQRSGCKGGMMEQWHQKLHNNSSPDDVVICRALLAYISSGLELPAYWSELAKGGVTRERLASFDRAITHEPSFTPAQAAVLAPDLAAYLDTLVAVHGGADLRSAADAVLGYSRGEVKGVAVSVDPVPGVASPLLAGLLGRLLDLGDGPEGGGAGGEDEIERALSAMRLAVAARRLLAAPIAAGNAGCGGRLKDVLFLDMALAAAARAASESSLHVIAAAAASGALPLPTALALLAAAAEGAALGAGGVAPGAAGVLRAEAVLVADQLRFLEGAEALPERARALQALAAADRASRLLGAASAATQAALQPAADALAAALRFGGEGCPAGPGALDTVAIFSEEEVRAGPAAALSNLLAALQPRLLALAGAGGWQVISRGAAPAGGGAAAVGPLLAVTSLADAGPAIAAAAAAGGAGNSRPLVMVERLRGEEDVPPGCGGVVVLGHCPDVLCHAAVRARGAGVPLVAALDGREAARAAALAGKTVALRLRGEAVLLEEAGAGDLAGAAEAGPPGGQPVATPVSAAASAAAAAPAAWCGRWVLPMAEFEPGLVGAKSTNTRRLAAALPAWLRTAASAAVPFGAFERGVLADAANAAAAAELARAGGELAGSGGGDASERERLLAQMRAAALRLEAPEGLRAALAAALAAQGQPSDAPAVAALWGAARRVYASQWGAGAEAALRAAGLPRAALRMAVLLQPVAPVRYAFVAHTRSPTTGRSDEVYVELAPGLGEALVSGDYPGRALGGAVARGPLDAALDAFDASGGAGKAGAGAGAAALLGAVKKALGGGGGGGLMPAADALRASVRVASYPSKGRLLPAPRPGAPGAGGAPFVMARSDSNAEDLPGCSGAGLFESWCAAPLTPALADYAPDPLCADEPSALHALWAAALAAAAAERALGGRAPQDVEGGIGWDGDVWVLQSRDQA